MISNNYFASKIFQIEQAETREISTITLLLTIEVAETKLKRICHELSDSTYDPLRT